MVRRRFQFDGEKESKGPSDFANRNDAKTGEDMNIAETSVQVENHSLAGYGSNTVVASTSAFPNQSQMTRGATTTAEFPYHPTATTRLYTEAQGTASYNPNAYNTFAGVARRSAGNRTGNFMLDYGTGSQ